MVLCPAITDSFIVVQEIGAYPAVLNAKDQEVEVIQWIDS